VKPPARVAIGQVVGAHGVRGDIKVRFFGDGPENLLQAGTLMLGAGVDDAGAVSMEVRSATPAGSGEVRMTLAGVDDRDAAARLRGRLVLVDSGTLAPLGDGEHYQYELVGCTVEGDDGRTLGTVREVWPTGGADVLLIEGRDGREQLIPTGGDFLQELDVAGRRVVIRVLPGLLDPP